MTPLVPPEALVTSWRRGLLFGVAAVLLAGAAASTAVGLNRGAPAAAAGASTDNGWVYACLAKGELSAAPLEGPTRLTGTAAVDLARPLHAVFRGAPSTADLVKLSPTDPQGRPQVGLITRSVGRPMWAVGFSGLHIAWDAGLGSNAPRWITGWVELVDDETGQVTEGIGCW